MRHFPKNLRYLRKIAKLSQEALANQLGLNRGNIASYEKGSAEPNIANLLKIARFFQVDLVDFLDKDLSHSPMADQMRIRKTESGKTNIPIKKEDLKDEREDHFANEDNLSSVRVIGERLLNLGNILNGFKAYHRFRVSRTENPSVDMQRLFLDYERSLEITEELIEIGKQLLSKYADLKEKIQNR